MSEIEGVVELGETRRGKRTSSFAPRGAWSGTSGSARPHLRVHRGDSVRAGEALVEGPLVPQDLLRISGEEKLSTTFCAKFRTYTVCRTQD